MLKNSRGWIKLNHRPKNKGEKCVSNNLYGYHGQQTFCFSKCGGSITGKLQANDSDLHKGQKEKFFL